MCDIKKRIPSIEDYYKIQYTTMPDYCQEKNMLAYVVSHAEKTHYVQQIMFKNLQTDVTESITVGGDVETDPRISPDGSKLLFISNATGDPQICLVDLETRNIRRLTSMRYGVKSPVWSPKGDKIAFLSAAPSKEDPETFQVMRDPKVIAEEEENRRNQPMATENLGYKSDEFMGFKRDVFPTHVWVIGIQDNTAKCLTDLDKRHVMPVWSPDGEDILFVSNREREPKDFLGMDLFTVSACGGQIKRLSKDITVAFYPKRIVPRYTPDGKYIVFGALDLKGEGFPPCYLYRIPAEGGEAVRIFNDDAPCEGVTRFLYNAEHYGDVYETLQISSDSKYAYFISGWHGKGNIYRVNIEGTPLVEEVTKGKDNYSSLSKSYNGKIVVTKCDALHLEEVYLLDEETLEEIQLTEHNPWLKDVSLSDMDELWINTLDGKANIQGWVIKPQNAVEGEKYPAVLYIHGGPSPFYGYALSYEYQCLAAQGIGVILVNPRGSTGYGVKHSDMRLAFDGTAYYDLLQYIDEAVRKFDWIDGERLGVCGGSYGGYMTNWIITHSKRFKAAATHRSVVNNLISYGSSDSGIQNGSKNFASFEEFMLRELEKSPITYSDEIDIPLLILHSTKDMRCPVEGAHQLYVAVKDQHPEVPSRLVLFPNSNHGLLGGGPMYLQIIHINENINWFKKYL